MKDFYLEQEKLRNTLSIIQKVLKLEREELEELYNSFIGNREDLWRIANSKEVHIKNLKMSLEKPYFARIDFTSDDNNQMCSLYIGKNGITDNSKIVVTDWRAPISSLYYDSELGKCSYEAPDGTMTGEMTLKRQYEIEHGELLKYFDVDLVSNDELLQKYLNANNDARLKSIVATIQKEQNSVIRKSLFDDIIVQGVAGSGKTTVALHRIAYLVYNYIKTIRQNQYLIIGPNPVFLKYIKSVLPELDVTGINQYTYEQFVRKYIEESIDINLSKIKIANSISGKNNTDIDKFKCSMKYKNMIDKFLEVYFQSLAIKPLMLGYFEVLSGEQIKEIFDSVNASNLKAKIELVIQKMYNVIETRYDKIVSKFNDYCFEVFDEASDDFERNQIRNKLGKYRDELDKKCLSTIRKYFSVIKYDPTKLYSLFLKTINDYNIYNYQYLSKLKSETTKNIKNGKYDFEDLAALLYIKSVVYPNKLYSDVKHVVIDEAQDFGQFNFYSLKNSLSEATFSIFGDLAQSIYDYRGIENWDEVNEIMFNNTGSIIYFNKSYRTTSEIMKTADDISDYIGLGRSELVVRHGNNVAFNNIGPDEIIEHIIQKIKEYKEKGYKNIAIISKTDLLSSYMNDDLSFSGVNVPNILENSDVNSEGVNVCTISNRLAKGLEFDAVIIPDASEKIYQSDNKLDMKLLYVAITRALHELDISYSGTLTKPLVKVKTKK